MVSISAVEVSRDLAHAKVFFSTLGDAEDQTQSLQVLTGAAGHLRHLLGRSLRMRSIPQLRFYPDNSLQQGAYMSALIDKAVQSEHEQ